MKYWTVQHLQTSLRTKIKCASAQLHSESTCQIKQTSLINVRKVKLTVDATAKAHGEPVSMLAMDWNSLRIQFKVTFGADLCEEDLPPQNYFEEFEERVAEGNFEAERLSEVVSKKKLICNAAVNQTQQDNTACT